MIIAAVRNREEYNSALLSSGKIIFDLSPSVLDLEEKVEKAHKHNKKIFIHLDLAEGIGKDRAGVCFVKKLGVDGIISTRVSVIKIAREEKLFTVQRFFIVDSQSVLTTVESVKAAKPDMIEVMPGIANKVIESLSKSLSVPVIAGGLVETKDEVLNALKCGATAVSTGRAELWEI